jgi:NAD(P)-dependent dehydrogenase (short-subunit alcohol dehydrogenase family)
MDLQLKERTVAVTGAASGIGRATALFLAAEGARVACLDVQEEAARKTATEIEGGGGQAIALALDVAQPRSVENAIARTVARFGGLHALVNAAGIGGFVKFEDMTLEEWNRVIGVNLTGTFLMCHAALPHLLANETSAVVNIASIAGLKGQPYSSAYGASKGGVALMSRGLAIEFAKRGLRVNCVCPGGVNTPILHGFNLEGLDFSLLATIRNPTNSMCEPIEVARLIAFLLSDCASYINGVTYAIDGGTLA